MIVDDLHRERTGEHRSLAEVQAAVDVTFDVWFEQIRAREARAQKPAERSDQPQVVLAEVIREHYRAHADRVDEQEF